jgi:MFS family permease
MKIRVNINVKVGRLVKYFILSDFFLLAGWGFIDPVFSVFIIQHVEGATLITVGIAAAIYWVLRSLVQIPIANYIDKTPGEKDDFMALIGGILLVGISVIAMSWVTEIWQLYLVHAVQAVAFAMYFAAWPTIFSRHLDKNRISFDWSLDSAATGVASGITGLLSGIIAESMGFTAVFVIGGLLSFVAAFVLIATPDLILPKPTTKGIPMDDRKPAELDA